MEQGHRIGTIIALVTAIVVLCAGSAYMGYSYSNYEAKIDEQNFNYTQGQNIGEKIGYDKGYKEGREAGLKEAVSGYNLHDPTYKEMKDFLAEDQSDSKPYNKDERSCTDFTHEVNNNAEAKGIRCASVYIIYPETGHSIVAFNTTDRGMIFIESQYDKEVNLTVGRSYSQSNGFIKPQDLDDTIVRYLLMW